MPKTSRRELGDRGEDIACQYYIDHGYVIVDRNVTISRVGEIDVIAARVVGDITEYVFVEVKTRSSSYAGQGYEAVDYKKRVRMRNCAMAWLRENIDRHKTSWHLDVASIDYSRSVPTIRVFNNIEV